MSDKDSRIYLTVTVAMPLLFLILMDICAHCAPIRKGQIEDYAVRNTGDTMTGDLSAATSTIQAATGDFDNLIIGGEPYATPTPQQIPSDIVISVTDNVILGANYYQYILPNWDDETSLYYGKMFRSGTPIVRVGEALDSEYTPYVVFLNGAKVGSHRGFKVILADGEYFTVAHRVYMFAFLDDVSADAQTFASLDKDIETQFQFASDPIGIRLGGTHTRSY